MDTSERYMFLDLNILFLEHIFEHFDLFDKRNNFLYKSYLMDDLVYLDNMFDNFINNDLCDDIVVNLSYGDGVRLLFSGYMRILGLFLDIVNKRIDDDFLGIDCILYNISLKYFIIDILSQFNLWLVRFNSLS